MSTGRAAFLQGKSQLAFERKRFLEVFVLQFVKIVDLLLSEASLIWSFSWENFDKSNFRKKIS